MASIRAKALRNSTIIVTPKKLGGLMSAKSMFQSVFTDEKDVKVNKNKNVKDSDSSDDTSESDEEFDDNDIVAEKEKLMAKMNILLEKEKQKKRKIRKNLKRRKYIRSKVLFLTNK